MLQASPLVQFADASHLFGSIVLSVIVLALVNALKDQKPRDPREQPDPSPPNVTPTDPKEQEDLAEAQLAQRIQTAQHPREYWESYEFQGVLGYLGDEEYDDHALRELACMGHRKLATVALSRLIEKHGLDAEDEVLASLAGKDIWTHYIVLFQLEALHEPSDAWVPRLLIQLDRSWFGEATLWILRELLARRRQRGEVIPDEESWAAWYEAQGESQQELFSDILDALGPTTAKPWLEAMQTYSKREGAREPAVQSAPGGNERAPAGTRELLQCGRVWHEDARELLEQGEPYAPAVEAAERVVEYLTQSSPRPVVVVGAPRTGKSTLIRRAMDQLLARNWTALEATPSAINAGMSYVGQLEARTAELVKATAPDRHFLWVAPDFTSMLTVGTTTTSPTRGLASLLREALQGRHITVLGECSREEWTHACLLAPWLEECFEVVEVPIPDPTQTIELVESWYRERKKMPVVRELTQEAWNLVRQFQQESQRPGNLFDLMRRACEDAQRRQGPRSLPTRADLLTSLSRATGLPLELLDVRHVLDPGELEAHFKSRIHGQDEAVACLVDRVAMMKAGVTDPTRPLGVFLFAGPTGTGKTELAKTLAAWLFGSESRLIRLDMSEFQDASSMNTLLGTSQELSMGSGSNFVDQVRRQPYSVILLDEFEKASPRVWDLFLQVFDDGRLSDRLGRTVDFRHCMILLTTNLGSRVEASSALGFTARAMGFRPEKVHEALRQSFRPEFLNRLDRVVVFRPLTRQVMGSILRRQIDLATRRRGLRDRPWAAEWDDAAMEFLIDKGFSEELGARPMQRALERYVLTPLARAIVSQNTPEGDQFLFVRVRGDELVIDFVDPDAPREELESESEMGPNETGGVREIALHTQGTRDEWSTVEAELQRLEHEVSVDTWMEARKNELEMTSLPDFWNAPERFEVLELFASRERIERALEAARSLLDRLGTHSSPHVPREPLRRLALRLHILDAALRDIQGRHPNEVLVVVQERPSELKGEHAARFAERLSEMYRAWAARRGARLREWGRTDGLTHGGWVASIQSFGAWSLLHEETGLHIWERHVPDAPGSTERDTLLVQVLPIAPSDRDPEIRALARRALTDPDPAPQRQVVRRYREAPSPLVRDSARGWRTGHLDWVLAGDFDLIVDAPSS